MEKTFLIVLLVASCFAGLLLFGKNTLQQKQLKDQARQQMNLVAKQQQKLVESLQGVMIEFNVGHYDTLKKISKTYVDDIPANDKILAKLWDDFFEKNGDVIVEFILQYTQAVTSKTISEEEKNALVQLIKEQLRVSGLQNFKQAYVVSSKVYKRVQAEKRAKKELNLKK